LYDIAIDCRIKVYIITITIVNVFIIASLWFLLKKPLHATCSLLELLLKLFLQLRHILGLLHLLLLLSEMNVTEIHC